jgi:phage virion morphogenesis protein
MLTIEVHDMAIIEALNRAAAQFNNLAPLYQSIGQILLASTRDRFEQGTTPDGKKWQAKSPETLQKYAKDRAGAAALSRVLFGPSGALNSSISVEPEADQVTIGSNMIYARMMQYGGTKAQFPHLWGNIPARPFIGLSQEDITNIVAETEEFIARSLGEQR